MYQHNGQPLNWFVTQRLLVTRLEGAPPSLAGDNVLARSQTFSTPPPPPSFPTPTSNHKFPKNVPSAIWVNSLGQKMGDAVVVQPFLLTVLMCTR